MTWKPIHRDDNELLRLVHALRADPQLRVAFDAVLELSQKATDADDPARFTYNKLLWIMGL